MLGLEENMSGEVIDLRPDRFLREMRDHGSLVKACMNSGMSHAEFQDLCQSNLSFDRAQVDCYLEHTEDEIMTEARKRLGKVRHACYFELRSRHGKLPPETFGKGGDDDTKNCG